MGDREYLVGTNSSAETIAELNALPIRTVNGAVVLKDVAWPIVEVQTVHIASSEQVLTLPGTVIPLRSAHIYARVSGYLKGPVCGPGGYGTQGSVAGDHLGSRPGRLGSTADRSPRHPEAGRRKPHFHLIEKVRESKFKGF
ncbi:efflux RND transporter permease subunit [Alloacidobacterium dinghuense]|uniref:Efflux RND transporter permease subunit n=1 Tax=Alloacidobacterium dinghuense TaxID=2763107 RepID=A0A7G8BEW6_9BACT|nr:efflux RND transporter permease subunit [Alloacidobacterium dinghuense]QNI31086.1 efflux RND transporter permease subunit [Alloacidobacterium dinghuense]